MDGVYGGSRGELGRVGFLAKQLRFRGPKEVRSLKIPSPKTVYRFDKPIPEDELIALQEEEKESIICLTKMLSRNKHIGGLLMETILGPLGVYYYRREFLLQVAAVCKKYNVLLIVDEVLTGGGCTGKFFAFEHYPGFIPDLITFGKGLVLAGIAKHLQSKLMSTLPHSPVTKKCVIISFKTSLNKHKIIVILYITQTKSTNRIITKNSSYYYILPF